ncbi:carboxylesterase family protein [Aneurinibacillus migulanus]|uniref:Carboxylic ester hydrolase n=1 Tax=Aneurinibacillus migulanus TaxID=47500 RepID=A0A1G8MDN5_ANEMI|nr:carboxylesterase family protein [Aneurinibacillus migulanus]MED0893728.1 carboxylesterase family protein [Aneurinibacillus migulanus]MED1617768.1 carboxylesterase family protein [Aneurinibacillus migulanus]GED12595.1 para-nitrobenzyl esterase [Aneurinibacillus migulanus]SDI66089.1 para-nitrobenzyl esterase [Aneurinibacillus migulanus]
MNSNIQGKIIATCQQGDLQGIVEEDVLAFYNIPYGENRGRFQPVDRPSCWQGIRDAARPGPVFPQLRSRLAPVIGTTPEEANQSEDAFRLNIWTRDTKGKLPVLFWIHGGGFMTGGGALRWYHGNQLAASGRIVVVTVNYRLGSLGNLYLPGVSEGNLALRDLLAALHWVQDNIAAFGGDPNSITIAGQSAGAWYSTALMACKQAQGLFKQVCLLSCPGSIQPMSKEGAQHLAERLCEKLEVSSSGEQLASLQIDQLLAAESELAKEIARPYEVSLSFIPIADGVLLHEDIMADAIAVSGGKITLMVGTTKEETTAFLHANHDTICSLPEPLVLEPFRKFYGEHAKTAFDHYKTRRLHANNYTQIVDMTSDQMFSFPTHQFASNMSAAGSDTFVYYFVYPSRNSWLVSCHCMELPFLFGNFEKWENAPMLEDADDDNIRLLSNKLQQALLNFVVLGVPNTEDSILWPKYNVEKRMTLVLDEESEAVSDPLDMQSHIHELIFN